jgi:signal transduction histidine kinase/ligand-binding sensor domain-containing protein
MPKIFRHTFYGCLLLICGASYGQNFQDQYYFKRYNIEHGLSESSVNTITTDKNGFVWLGTHSGLDKFDGYDFQTFHHNDQNTNSLTNNSVQDLEIDAHNNLWIGTSNGLNKLSLSTYQFTKYDAIGGNTNDFRKITLDSALNRLWAPLLQGGLYYVDIDADTLLKYSHQALEGYQIYDVVRYDAEVIAVATLDAGVFLINLKTNEYTQYHKDGIGQYKLPGNIVRGLEVINDTIWIGLQSNGLVSINVAQEQNTLRTTQNSNLISDQIFVLSTDENNNLLIGTDGGGFSILSAETGKISTYLNIEGDVNSLSSNVIRSITNTEHYIFLGTYKGGLNVLNKYSKQFTTLKRNYAMSNSLSANSIKCFEEEEDGGFWIGSDGGGIDFLSKQGVITNVTSINNSLQTNKIICLEKDSNGTLWIGDFNTGLFSYADGVLKRMNDYPRYNNIIGQNIWDVESDSNDNLWVGTNQGLYYYHYDKDSFVHVPSIHHDGHDFQRQEIRVIKKDSEKGIWVGSIGGLYHYDLEQDVFKFYTSSDSSHYLSQDLVVSLFIDDQRVYAGTFGAGMNIIDKATNATTVISTKDNQLPSDIIFGILKDYKNRIWVSSNSGITALSGDNFEPLQTFNHHDGLQGDIFNKNASYLTSDSLLFFGGINGFNIIDPSQIEFSNRQTNIAISTFEIYNKPVVIKSPGILSTEINDAKNISIPFTEASLISFKFSGNEFIYQNRLQYAYKLEGFDTQWNYIGKERKISFTNLSPQTYRLLLKSSFDGVDWSTEPKIITIEIVPPWWMTLYFKLALAITVIIIIASIFLLRVRSLKRVQLTLRREVRHKTKEITDQNEELNQLSEKLLESNNLLENEVDNRTRKLNITIGQLNKTIVELDRFVYSASHDLSAPLKSILGLIEIARLDQDKETTEEYLNYIQMSIFKLEKVIFSLAQFSDNSKNNVLVQKLKIDEIVSQVFSELDHDSSPVTHELVVHKNGPCIVLSDRRKVNIIIHNLLSNALKYYDSRNEKHLITVDITNQTSQCTIAINDNGIGFDPKYVNRIFEMFFRANENVFGSGLGLYIVKETIDKLGGTIVVESDKGKGTTFTLTIPN